VSIGACQWKAGTGELAAWKINRSSSFNKLGPMTLLAFGINHNTASLDFREQISFAPENVQTALRMACHEEGLDEVVILSTCNRTELYVHGKVDSVSLIRWLVHFQKVSQTDLDSSHYSYEDDQAIEHMMRVASGLDSMVLGEPQILGQMKSAYAVGCEAGTVGSCLHGAFHQVFSIAKKIRTETSIGQNPVSVAYAAVNLAQQIFSDLRQDTALLVGAGETIELVARHLTEQKIGRLIVANRTLGRAHELAEKFSAEAILLADIPENLYRADIVITSTASQLPLLGKGAVESALKRRKHKPMFMVDIAVPRDIEPEVGKLDDVYLYSVDDLREVIDENMRSRQEAAEKAHFIVIAGVQEYTQQVKARGSVNTIKAYRQKAEKIRDVELDKAIKSLGLGVAADVVVQQLARGLTNKLMHAPTKRLKQAGVAGETELLNLSLQLFDLSDSKAADN
jgi:glutamyl-tRNA reductase